MLQEHKTLSLCEYEPLAVGRVFREKVALAIAGGALDRYGFSSIAIVERHCIEIEEELGVTFR